MCVLCSRDKEMHMSVPLVRTLLEIKNIIYVLYLSFRLPKVSSWL